MPEIAVESASLIVERVSGELPTGFDALSAEAAGEGHRHLARFATEWRAGRRFDRDGEALIVARLHGELAGIGGLTIDPTVPDALRMRRFYVRSLYRRHGIGRLLAERLLAQARPLRQRIAVNAAPGSERFWEALGFIAEARDGHTHVFCGR